MAAGTFKYVGPPGQRIAGLHPTPGDELKLDAEQAKAVKGHRWFEPVSAKKTKPTVG